MAMKGSRIKEGLLLVVPAVAVPLAVVWLAQGRLEPPQVTLPPAAVAPGQVQPAEVVSVVSPVPPAPTSAPPPRRAETVLRATPAEVPASEQPTPTRAAAEEPSPSPAPARGEAPSGVTVTSPNPPAAPASDPLLRGRQVTRLFYTERLGEVWAAFSPGVRTEWDGLEGFRAYRASGQRTYGAETGVLREEVRRDGALTYYLRTATFERGPEGPWTTIVGLDQQGRVQQFGIVQSDLLPGARSGAQGSEAR